MTTTRGRGGKEEEKNERKWRTRENGESKEL